MSYCSLEEAYGTDFYRQVNNDHHLDVSYQKQMNPSRNHNTYLPGERHGTELSRVKQARDSRKDAMRQSRNDVTSHRESFSSVSGNRRFEAPPNSRMEKTMRAWGEIEPLSINYDQNYPPPDEISPREHLKKSLLSDRGFSYHDEGSVSNYEPQGYHKQMTNYKTIKHTPCQDYFYHLDTCKKCQAKLKKRVIRYFKALERQKRKTLSLPGTRDIGINADRELFTDEDYDIEYPEIESGNQKNKDNEKDSEKKSDKKKIIENFSLDTSFNTQPLFLIFFGLFIIYMLDISKKIVK